MAHKGFELQEIQRRVLPLVQAAGERLCTSFAQATQKADGSLVTAADIITERLLTDQLRAIYPQIAMLAEEQHHHYGGTPWCWVLDPIDGTTNFVLGIPIWGLSLALLYQGEPVFGVLHFPLLRATYTAILGQGAYCDGRRLETMRTDRPVVEAVSFCARSYARWQLQPPYKPRMLGCTAYNFALVAAGVVAAGLDLDVHVWDVAAGALLVQEAGGFIGYLDTPGLFPLQAGVDYRQNSFSSLCAANILVADQLLVHLRPRE
jgi:myo-inositol-1(or 4)-monophosphatase